jgi:hypothetical protein
MDPGEAMAAQCDCPGAEASDCWTAHVVADHLDQGWAKLCNGVILFDDGFFIAPDGHVESIGGVAA